MNAKAPRFPPRFASGADGEGLYEIAFSGGAEVNDAASLRKRAAVLDAVERAAGGLPIVTADGEHPLEELTRLAKNLVRSRGEHVLSVLEVPGAATALEKGGAHVWRVPGAEYVVFASKAPPEYVAGLEPLSKHADFPKPAVRPLRLVRKDDTPDPGEVLPDKQLVYGIVLEPEVQDSQGDIYSADEIESACHLYLENFQQVGHMHQTMLSSDTARVVESYVAPVDFTMGGQAVKAGTWILVIHVLNEDLWAQIKGGELTGLSIGGWAQRVPTGGGAEATAPSPG